MIVQLIVLKTQTGRTGRGILGRINRQNGKITSNGKTFVIGSVVYMTLHLVQKNKVFSPALFSDGYVQPNIQKTSFQRVNLNKVREIPQHM